MHPKLKKYLDQIDFGTLQRLILNKSGYAPMFSHDLSENYQLRFWVPRHSENRPVTLIHYHVVKMSQIDGYAVSTTVETGQLRKPVPVEPEVEIELNVEQGRKLLSRRKMKVKDGDNVTISLN